MPDTITADTPGTGYTCYGDRDGGDDDRTKIVKIKRDMTAPSAAPGPGAAA